MAANRVIAGDYQGKGMLSGPGGVSITTSLTGRVKIGKDTVVKCEIVTQENKGGYSLAGGALGELFFGTAGAIAGGVRRNKAEILLAVEFKDGKRSLLEIDNKIHKAIIKSMF